MKFDAPLFPISGGYYMCSQQVIYMLQGAPMTCLQIDRLTAIFIPLKHNSLKY